MKLGGAPEQVHIVGPDQRVGHVVRQRCVWCGALILEYDMANIGVRVVPGEQTAAPGIWEVGALVSIVGTNPQVTTTLEHEVHPDSENGADFTIPPNSCMALDPEVTR